MPRETKAEREESRVEYDEPGPSQPDAVRAPEGEDHRGSHVELDASEARAPTFGMLNGWREAEAIARRRFPRITEEAWVGARGMFGCPPGRGVVTPDFVARAAESWTFMQNVKLPTEEELQREIAEDARLEKMSEDLAAAKKKRGR